MIYLFRKQDMKDYKKENKQLRKEKIELENSKNYYYELWKEEKEKNDRTIRRNNDYNQLEIHSKSIEIELARYRGMVDVYERITDTKEYNENIDLSLN